MRKLLAVFRRPISRVSAIKRIMLSGFAGIIFILLTVVGVADSLTVSSLQNQHLSTVGHVSCTPVYDIRTGVYTGQDDCNVLYEVDGKHFQIVVHSGSGPQDPFEHSSPVVFYEPSNPSAADISSDVQDGPQTGWLVSGIFALLSLLTVTYGVRAALTLRTLTV